MVTLAEAWQEGSDRLHQAGVESPRLDSEVLLRHVLGKGRAEFFRDLGEPLAAGVLERFRTLVARRVQGTPVAYLTGHKEFFGLDFKVTPAVLIPRPETEILVERALQVAADLVAAKGELRILDLGTGSGAIAVTLAVGLPTVRLVATDCSPAALEVAAANAKRHGVRERIAFRLGDLWGALREEDVIPGHPFDIIVSNPPYIPAGELEQLPADVKHEPPAALDGGPDGLAFYRRLATGIGPRLAPRGWVLLEVGAGQAPAVCRLLMGAGLTPLSPVKDLAGIERVVQATNRALDRGNKEC
ncbi:peptide chain release factor N(5)-glutamine methyltransferase [Gelria sp. Kuro-4]|uniref:peptide chain release factor N(5)-glutamine methyltransferase n=1 Tax=Gelria sp. Kuro-4 TaxID=2796927 RepID=UPI001BF15ABE|nr:peptide chain release factor N(5)-glutamine methyltransferase [Gelria sp. Kuro-4]BCV24084.1 release factor glutamine methyltransferase [Gelria sp. Kuro-4]